MSTWTSHPSKLTLGTVQLGLPYGVANETGQPDETKAFGILDAAFNGGIKWFDTAQAYGESEARIGRWLAGNDNNPLIISKLAKLNDDELSLSEAVQSGLAASLKVLGLDRIDGYMLHHHADLYKKGVYETLCEFVDQGVVGRIGVSAYGIPDINRALEMPRVSLLQAPFNLFDNNAEKSGLTDVLRNRDITFFARSVYLQGAILMKPENLPKHLAPAKKSLIALHSFAEEIGRTLKEIAFLAVRDTPGVSSMVVGVETLAQLDETIAMMNLEPLADEERLEAFRIAEGMPEEIIHPHLWPK